MDEKQITSLRRMIASLARNRYKRRYPPALRARLVAFVKAHPDQSMTTLATTLGMARQTLEKIAAEPRTAIVPVKVRADPKASSALIIRGPRGIVVEGLDVAGAVELIRALS